MSSTVDGHTDHTAFDQPGYDGPPPPHYTEKGGSPVHRADLKVTNDADYKHGPWLLKRTSIHVESTPSNVLEDKFSDHASISTTRSEEKRAARNLLFKFGRQQATEQHRDDRISIAESNETSIFGTTVSIQAGQARKISSKQREMKGLEQAASVKKWASNGKPAEAWGKLIKDPELWDSKGDTLVYFGYQRPHASFRTQSSLLEATKSDFLLGKLRDGFQRTSKASTAELSLPGFQKLNVGHPGTPSLIESTDSGSACRPRYEIHFPSPDEGSKTTILRHHITTRNFFAMLLNKPLVGLTFYQALVDLHQRLQLYMPRDVDCAELLINYLTRNCLHNVSKDPIAAAGLLAWCEDPEVQWRDGWREGFVHCCGMYGRLEDLPESQDISHVSRTLLERSHLELEARIQTSETKLSSFDFDDIWAGTEAQLHPSRTVFDQFRRFLQQHYTKTYKHWPPTARGESNGTWLTSDIVFQLQRDFAALYEYHIDRTVVWDKAKSPGTTLISELDGQSVESKGTTLCLAKLLYHFDEQHRYTHIPHPFPLLPDPSVVHNETKQSKTHFFSSKAKALEKRLIYALSEASNATLLGPDIATNGLAEAFLRFEKTDGIGNVDPQSARKARWMLVYGALQVLATLSVDTPNLFFTEDVSYFLNPRLKGMPPWKTDAKEEFEEASSRLSYCWQTPKISWGKGV